METLENVVVLLRPTRRKTARPGVIPMYGHDKNGRLYKIRRKAPVLTMTDKQREDWDDWRPAFINKLCRQARKNAILRRIEFGLSPDDVKLIYVAQRMKCAVSRIPFDHTQNEKGKRRPFAPSVDRIDNRRGYFPDNIRLVCQIVNMAMNEWGLGPLHELVRQMRGVRNALPPE